MMNFAQGIRNTMIHRKRRILSKWFNAWRGISTSQKSGEVGSVTMDPEAQQVKRRKKIRNWQSYGFDFVDQRQDYLRMHVYSFCGIVGILWGSFFIMAYNPDSAEHDWAAREARILVRKREILGLPLVDPNYVDPALIKLPPDEDIPGEDLII